MELWIRSQDREELRPNPRLGIEKNMNSWYIVDRYAFDSSYALGRYKTEKRAIEVLDEIQDLLQNAYVGGSNRIVYQMPEE